VRLQLTTKDQYSIRRSTVINSNNTNKPTKQDLSTFSNMFTFYSSLLLYTSSVLAGLFIVLYLYFSRNFDFWKKRGIPYEKPLPFVGNLKEAALQRVHVGRNLKQIYDQHKSKPYIGFFSFDQPSLLFNDPELIKRILVEDAQYFVNRTQAANEEVDPLTGKAIFALKDAKWKRTRAAMTPIFTTNKMKKMFYLIEKCAKELKLYMDKQMADGLPLDVKDAMSRYTTDIITSVAFGIEGNSLKNRDAEFNKCTRKLVEYTTLKSFATLAVSFAPALQSVLRLKIVDDDILTFLRKSVWSTVQYREKNNVDRKDFLDSMMVLRKRGQEASGAQNIIPMDGDDFVAQSFAFLFAGFESTSSTMTFAFYELALQPAIQDRLRTEIARVMEKYNQVLTYEAILDMPYLDMVISETLRKYPLVPFIDRACSRDWKFPDSSEHSDVTIPRGTATYIPLYGIHHDPQYYPDPERFDPERFTQENMAKRHPFTYLPFGGGPRICLGRRFAMMQTKTGMVHILSHFEVALWKDTPVPIKLHPKPFLLQPLEDIYLVLKKTSTETRTVQA